MLAKIRSASCCAGLVGALVLPALTLTTRDAHALWECDIVDGQDSTYYWATLQPVSGSTAAIKWNGYVLPLYWRGTPQFGPSYPTYIREPVDYSFDSEPCSGNEGYWEDFDQTGNAYEWNPTALQVGGTTWFAYACYGGALCAGSAYNGPGTGSIVDYALVYDVPSIAADPFSNKVWIFYTDYKQASQSGLANLKLLTYNGVSSTAPEIFNEYIVGTSGPYNSPSPLASPSAVPFADDVFLFFPTCGLSGCQLSGFNFYGTHGAFGPSLGDLDPGNDGFFPKAIVNGSQLYVFHYSASGGLRVSYTTDGVGDSWAVQTVDSSAKLSFPAAPVLYNGSLMVFYVDENTHSVKQAWQSGSGWATVTIDGGSSNNNNCQINSGTGTTRTLEGPISAVASVGCLGGDSTSLHIFYADSYRNNLREAFWN
jgi:hypothetical protein